MTTKENPNKLAWEQWYAYRAKNMPMTLEEEREIMEELGCFDDWEAEETEMGEENA